MRVAMLSGPKSVTIDERPEPTLLPGSLIIAVDRCGISGTDRHGWAQGVVENPAWFGHEWVGRVQAIAPDVTGHFEGERVVGAVPPPCGACRPCRASLPEHCDLAFDMIVGADPLASAHGAFAPLIRVDARRVLTVPDGLDDTQAALTEPAAVAAHAVSRHPMRLGGVAVVIGAGTIGLLVTELIRLRGAGAVVAIDPHRSRQELACDHGADAAFGPGRDVEQWLGARTGGLGADIVIDCAGTPDSLASTATYVRRGGAVIVAGVGPGAMLQWTAKTHEREVTILGSLGYNRGDAVTAMTLMSVDRLRLVGAIESAPIGLGETGAAFERLELQGAGGQKIMVDPQQP